MIDAFEQWQAANGEQVTTPTPEGDEAPLVCRRCHSSNLVGPFEMDGMDHGTYRPHGMWWTVCRECGTTTSVGR